MKTFSPHGETMGRGREKVEKQPPIFDDKESFLPSMRVHMNAVKQNKSG